MAQRFTAYLFLGAAIVIASSPAQAQSHLRLAMGAYVSASVPCNQAANGSLMWWNGRALSAGGISNIVPRAGSRGSFNSTYVNYQDGNATERVTIVVRGSTRFTWVNRWGRLRYRFCADAALPSQWRGMTPR
ncbi:MAG: hypothetical protein WDN31_02450 [Hyphomicrobium sp.]